MAIIPKNTDQGAVYVCCHCDRQYNSAAQFYKISSGVYANIGRLPICKDCVENLMESYAREYRGDMRKSLQRFCMIFDLYYSDKMYDACINSGNFGIGSYIAKMNMRQFKQRSFSTTLEEGFTFGFKQGVVYTPDSSVQSDQINPADIEKWGDGFDASDYRTLNNHYKYLKDANPQCDSNQEIFILDLCYTKMQQMKAVKAGEVDNYNKLTESYRKSFQQAGLKTVREASTVEDVSMGVTIETIEQYTPAEYYKDQKLYKDYDGIGDYAERFIFRPLRNLMHGTHDRDKEFYVKNEDESNGYDEELSD